MFQLQDVTKRYSRHGAEALAFGAESLHIERGDYVALVGPSGSGKTTLLSMLGGMLSPSTGKVYLAGVSLYDLSPEKRARLRQQQIGFVFQSFQLVPFLTAVENVEVPMCLAGVPTRRQRSRAVALLKQLHLGSRMMHKPSELSVGQQQRVALARTLANDPSVVLADEPTGNLDAPNRRLVLDFFDGLHSKGCTIVMVTHDPSAAGRASTLLQLQDGAIVDNAEHPTSKAA